MRLRCRFGRHAWGLWKHDTTPVMLMKWVDVDSVPPDMTQVGWEYAPIHGPTYRCCKHCPAMERSPEQAARPD